MTKNPCKASSGADDEFLIATAHELKNQLNLIHLNVEMLLRMSDEDGLPAVRGFAEKIRKAVLAQSRTVEEMQERVRRPGS